MSTRNILLFLVLGTIPLACKKQPKQTNFSDLVITNAKVITMDKQNPRAQAIAFKGEFIIDVTSNDLIQRYIEPAITRVIDAEGKTVIPGFNDAHTHFGPIDPDFIDLRNITDPTVISERVREKVKTVKPGVLIRGGHWEHEMFKDKKWPTKELIDPYTPLNPVILARTDGHSFLVNSYVLEKSGITKDTPDPPGGEIQRVSKTGEPTGILKESARRLIKIGDPKAQTPEVQSSDPMKGWQAALEMALGLGVTTVQVMSSSTQTTPTGDDNIYQKLKDTGKLTVRITFSAPLPDDEDTLQQYQILRKKYPLSNNWIRFGALKAFTDGTLGSGTALMFEPYRDAPGKTGLPQIPYQVLERRLVEADKHGFQVAVHAIGDKGVSWVLDACQKAVELNSKRDSRHRCEHAQIVHPKDFVRFGKLGVIASMQPTHCITDKRFAEKRIGLERCRGAYAWQSLLKHGAKLAFGTDYPVEPLNPFEGLYAAVTRKDRTGEEGEGWFPKQKLSMLKALELYTLGSAVAEFMEDRKGMIKKGYLGDVVVLDRDLLTTPEDQIMQTKVNFTVVGGKVVYKRDPR